MSGSIPSWFSAGAKIGCIDDDAAFASSGELIRPLRAEGEYVISRVTVVSTAFRGKSGVYVCASLVGVPNPLAGGWCVARFKPLITQQDDISTHFARYLNTGKDASLKPVREGV